MNNLNVPLKQNNFFINFIFYIFLFVFIEGSLRKWFLPQFNIEIILIRDFLIFWIVLIGFKNKIFITGASIERVTLFFSIFFFIVILIQQLVYNYNFGVTLIGIRNWILYLWFSILIYRVLNIKIFLKKILDILLYLTSITFIIITIQHLSPSTAFINQNIGTDIYIFEVARDIVRVTGTFSFTYGYVQFIYFLTPFILYYLDEGKNLGNTKRLLIFFMLIFCVFLSGSRSLIFYFLFQLFFFYVFVASHKILIIFKGLILSLIIYLIIENFFPNSILATLERFESASDKYVIHLRMLEIIFGNYNSWMNLSILGEGLGLSSNLSKFFINVDFILGENESDRIILGGGVFGIFILIFKFFLSFYFIIKGYKIFKSFNYSLPLLFSSYFIIQILTQQNTGQLTSHAFSFLSLGIMLSFLKIFNSSLNKNENYY